MATSNFQYSFDTAKGPSEIFRHLADPRNWWVGLFGEEIEGRSEKVGDEFTFRAGDGIHYSRQQLTELLPGRKIAWSVIESRLSFLENGAEWEGTKFGFDIEEEKGRTKVTFSHDGLTPHIECYDQCSSAWTQYLRKLENPA